MCVFCDIIAGKVPAEVLYQDEVVIAIRDIRPQAPLHLLVIPKVHIPSLNELAEEQKELASHLLWVATELAGREGVSPKGYRLVINCGQEGGQEVPHLHLHLLGGRQLSGTMG